MKPLIAYLRPHESLSNYEMNYVRLLEDEFALRIITTGNAAIGGAPEKITRMRWPDEFRWKGRSRSLINAIYARLMKRRYHIPGLGAVLDGVRIVQAGEAAGEVSYQGARLQDRFGYQLFLSASENTEIMAGRSSHERARIRYTLSKTSHAFAISFRSRDRLAEAGLDPRRITVIGHGIDCDRFRPAEASPTRDRLRVGYCGRFRLEKGLSYLLEATKDLPVETILLGEGPEGDSLRCQGAHAVFLPSRPYDEIHLFYRELDIFVLPSVPVRGLEEQYGFVLLEAMASGVPVIATDTGSIPEVLGDAALIVPHSDHRALRSALEELVAAPARRAEMAKRSRARALRHYRREDVADRMRAAYRRHVAD